MRKTYVPTELTIRKVRRVQEMLDNDWRTDEACREVGLRKTSFYFYRRRLKIPYTQKNGGKRAVS